MNNQIEITFGEIGRAITGKTPSSNDPEDFGEGFPFVTPTDSLDSKYVLHTARQLSNEGLRKLKSKALPPNSVLVSCIGSAMGKIVMNTTTCITNQQFNSIIVDTNRFCPHYIYYALRNSYKLLRNAASGSTALPMLNKTDFEKLQIRVFKDKAYQREIAAVFSALDAKIALNHRINGELEGLAKLLYDYWFVQYDFPLSAAQAAALGKPKLAGQPYRTSGGKMLFNPTLKREIPVGWEVGSVGDIAYNIRDGIDPKDADKETPYVGLEHIERQNFSLWRWGTSSDVDSQKSKFKKGDFLFGKLRPYFHKVCLTPFAGICSTDILVIRAKSLNYQSLVGCQIFESDFVAHTTKHSSGTQMPRANWNAMSDYKITIPDDQTLEAFNQLIQPLVLKCNNSVLENQELTALRDWLLPMLMNGQVRVANS